MSDDPKFQQMIADRIRGSRWIAVASLAAGLYCGFKYSSIGWIPVALSLVAVLVANLVVNAVHSIYLQVKYYGRDDEPTEELNVDELMTKIRKIPDVMTVHAKPEKRLAVWMDADIYDWIELIDSEGVIRRYNYVTVISEKQRRKFFELTENQILLEPGIIYELQVPTT